MVVGSYWEVGVGEMKGWDDWVHTYEERVVVEWGTRGRRFLIEFKFGGVGVGVGSI
jgi:hypothetical protein